MDIITIFSRLFQWGVPALIGGIGFVFLFISGYLIYKKVLHGKKELTKVQIISAFFLCCWGILVIGLTALSRGSNFTGSLNIDFLSGYISAWNNWSISELQLILFNMLMFVPLGFLLPLLWRKAEKLWVSLAISFAVTASLETFQFFTGTGIFELDDLFHNLIGSLFGYFCIMAILTPIHEKSFRFAPVAKVLLIPCAVSLTLGAVFYAYDHQPYGNMSILPAVKQDMSAVQIVTEWEPLEQSGTSAVYKNKYAEDSAYIQKVKTGLADLENLTFSRSTRRQDENIGYTGTDAKGTSFQVLFFFRTGEWNYTTFAEDTLRWDVISDKGIPAEAEAFQQGSVMMQFDEAGSLSSFTYLINWNEYEATENIASESQAFEQVKDGNFEQYIPFQPGDTFYIDKCELTYIYVQKSLPKPHLHAI